MSRTRNSIDAPKLPHCLSLKVLRLSRPSLKYQHALPQQYSDASIKINPLSALAYPSQDQDQSFLVSPLLTLPSTFGVTYIGETFCCSLCANNELAPDDTRSVQDVAIIAEMITPSQPKGIPMDIGDVEDVARGPSTLSSGGTLQRIVRHDLKEDGNHMLAVTVTYLEDGNLRTFRKLYQFIARQLLSVRTKIRTIPSRSLSEAASYALEAQLENLSDSGVVLQAVDLNVKSYIIAQSLNAWDADVGPKPMLNPGDILQVAYVLKEDLDTARIDETKDSRLPLAQMSISWRANMGEVGHLSTGWLSARRR